LYKFRERIVGITYIVTIAGCYKLCRWTRDVTTLQICRSGGTDAEQWTRHRV